MLRSTPDARTTVQTQTATAIPHRADTREPGGALLSPPPACIAHHTYARAHGARTRQWRFSKHPAIAACVHSAAWSPWPPAGSDVFCVGQSGQIVVRTPLSSICAADSSVSPPHGVPAEMQSPDAFRGRVAGSLPGWKKGQNPWGWDWCGPGIARPAPAWREDILHVQSREVERIR